MFDDREVQALLRTLPGKVVPQAQSSGGSSWESSTGTFQASPIRSGVGEAGAVGVVRSVLEHEIFPYLRSAAPNERPLHLSWRCSYTASLGSVRVTLALVVVTDVRAWVLDHSGGALHPPRVYSPQSVRITTTRFGGARFKEYVGSHLELIEPVRSAAGLGHALSAVPPARSQLLHDLVAEDPGAAVGGWHPDPTRRHELRWWDGTSWTSSVSNGSTTSNDPL